MALKKESSSSQLDLIPKIGTSSEGKNENERLNKLLNIHKTIRIAVSGDVFLTDLETKIIDTPDFQRLRGIRQLGSVNVVYPTALHTRFDHCLGTLAMVDRMLRAIETNTHSKGEEKKIDPIQKVLARLYALLHDVPHVPFGHTIEDELKIFERHDKNKARLEHFFGKNSPIGKLILETLGSDELHRRFLSIYTWDGVTTQGEHEVIKGLSPDQKSAEQKKASGPLDVEDDAFVYDLVSNTICADLLDYLARDFLFCNLGTPMEYRFLNFLYIGRDEKNLRRVFVRLWKDGKPEPRRDTLTDLTRLLEERYMVAERAYFHHAKIVAGTMVGRAILEAKETGVLSEQDLYAHSDDSLLYFLAYDVDSPEVAKKLARSYLERKLHKIQLTYSKGDFAGLQEHNRDKNPQNEALKKVADAKARLLLENRLADELGVPHGDIIIYAPGKSMNRKEAGMKILWNGKPSILKDIDYPIVDQRLKQILSAHEALWAIEIITRGGLTEEQKEILKTACDIEFVCPEQQLESKRQRYYERLIEIALRGTEITLPTTAAVYTEQRSKAAKSLTVSANDPRPFKERLKDAISKCFSDNQ